MSLWDLLDPTSRSLDELLGHDDPFGRPTETGRPLRIGLSGQTYEMPGRKPTRPRARPRPEPEGPPVAPFLPDGTPNPSWVGTPAHGRATRNQSAPQDIATSAARDLWSSVEAPTNPNATLGDVIATATDVASGGLGAGTAPAESLGMFAGRRARTADHDAMVRAEDLARGFTPDPEIHQETGWFRGADGGWRFEIDDSGAHLSPQFQPGFVGTVSEAIDHPELFEAYPQLRHMPVDYRAVALPHGLQGSYQEDYGAAMPGRIGISPEARDPRSTLLHELQHSVQGIEGFARGSNVNRVIDGNPALEELREQYLRDLVGNPPSFDEWRESFMAGVPYSHQNAYSEDRLRRDYEQYLGRLRDGILTPRDRTQADRFANVEGYNRSAGEVEARNTQHRRDMTAEERIANYPGDTEDRWRHQQIVDQAPPGSGEVQGSATTVDEWMRAFGKGQPDAGETFNSLYSHYGVGENSAPTGRGLGMNVLARGDDEYYRQHYAPQGRPAYVNLPGQGRFEARPIAPFEEAARSYMAGRGIDHQPVPEYPRFNEESARLVGAAYDVMPHAPQDPTVKRAYDAMIQETMDQYRALKDTGLDVQFIPPGMGDPYAASPALGYQDIVERGHLWTFPTTSGFGSSADFDPSTNPLLTRVGRVGDLDDATANDAFRVVHDAFGHFGPGNPFFRHQGEERAWLEHSRMYSPEARPAMTAETRGQNSWLNFGPYGESNRTALSKDTVFADQKSGVMPEWATDPNGLPSEEEREALERWIAANWQR